MSGRQLSGEPEEQVDLEGDVDGMDDDDGGYRRCGSHDDLEEEDNDARRAHNGDRMAAEPAAGVAAGDDDDDMYKEEGSGDGPDDEEENGKHGSEIFIGGLPCDVTEADIRELCEPLGEICEVRLTKDKKTKEHFGFVHFAERASALKAVKGRETYEQAH